MARKALGHHAATIDEPTINLTSLIDIVFVILIMFILVAPMLELDRVELADAPKKKSQDSIDIKEQSAITLHVRQDNSVLLNNRMIPLEDLPMALLRVKQECPSAKPQVFHDKRATFGTYQAVKNAMEAAGFEEMDIILRPA